MKKDQPDKELYQRLRRLDCEKLWREEVAAFDGLDASGRLRNVSVIRAVGVVFSEGGTSGQKEAARGWLRSLLSDPEEKIRRYAMRALPKIGVDAREEAELLVMLDAAPSDRERQFLGRALEKIGGSATLKRAGEGMLDQESLRKVMANVARSENPGRIDLDRRLEDFRGVQILLHCRAGLEEFVTGEFDERVRNGAPFRRVRCAEGLVVAAPRGPFTLGDIFSLRCFGHLGFALGEIQESRDEVKDLAALMASPASCRILEAFTEGPIRYRLEFVSKGHQRDAVRRLASQVYDLRPGLLNDARNALWQFNIRHARAGCSLELAPRLRPDPRFAYRQGDVPAASHPPLAACLARVAGSQPRETVWDPFCGSGLELIERSLRGGVERVVGTDLSASAIATARANLTAAVPETKTDLLQGDFRDFADMPALSPGSVSLVITNPPLGRRVPIADLPGLIGSMFQAAAHVLRPAGRLVMVNPVGSKPLGLPLRLDLQRRIDLGGFYCHLEKYTKV